MDTSGRSGQRRPVVGRASSTTVPGVLRMVSNRAAAARSMRQAAAAAAAAGTAAVVAVVTATDGDPVGHQACWPPTSVAGAQVTRTVLKVDRVADRSTRGNTSAVHPLVRMVVRPAVVGGGTVCGDTVNSGCGGSNRVGGAGRRGTRTGLAVPAGSGPALAAAVAAAGTGDWPKLVAMDSTTVVVADDTALAARNGNRAVLALTST